MSVYRKDSSGKLVKIAGSLTQRWNMLMLPTKHSKLSAINDEGKSFDYDCYEITEAAEPYITKLTEMTTYSLFLEDANETPIVIVKYKNQSLLVYGNTTISIGQLQGKIDLYTTGFGDFNIGNLVLNGTMPLSVDNTLLHESANPVMNSVLYDELEKITLSPGTNMSISDNNVIDTVHSPIFKQIISENTRNKISLDKLNNGVEIDVTGDQWSSITFDNVTSLDGSNVWYTENNVYYSYLTNHYKLVDGQWQPVVFNGLASFTGNNVWRHNGNTYYSAGSNQYVLNETTMTWSQKLWVGLTSFNGSNVWKWIDTSKTEIVCYSSASTQYMLESADKWMDVTGGAWSTLPSFTGSYVWTDHNDYYYSNGNQQYKLNKLSVDWQPITWNIQVYGSEIWYYDGQIYMSYQDKQYQLDMETMTWVVKDWLGLTEFDGSNVYANGTNYYYGSGTNQYVLGEANGVFKVSADKVTFNGQDITGGGDTSNFVQKNTVADLQGIQQDTTNDTVKLEFNNTTMAYDYIGTFVLLNENKTKSNNLAQISHFKHNTDISKQRLFSALSTQTDDDTVTYLIGSGAQTDGKGVFGSTYRSAGWFAEVFGQNLNTAKILELDTDGLWLDNKEISPNTVRYDQEQSLTDAQKTQARNNLGLNDTGVAWGSITGTLSDQIDLQNQLNSKLSTTGGNLTGAIAIKSTDGTLISHLNDDGTDDYGVSYKNNTFEFGNFGKGIKLLGNTARPKYESTTTEDGGVELALLSDLDKYLPLTGGTLTKSTEACLKFADSSTTPPLTPYIQFPKLTEGNELKMLLMTSTESRDYCGLISSLPISQTRYIVYGNVYMPTLLAGNDTHPKYATNLSSSDELQDIALLSDLANYVNTTKAQREFGMLIPKGTAIPSSANLNSVDYLKVGNYYCSADTTVATLTNCPTNSAFMMQVLSPLSPYYDNESTSAWVYRLRIITTYKGDVYYQASNSFATAGTFSYEDWQKVAKTSDIPNLLNKVYPVGSIYMSTINKSPAAFGLGGTWMQLKDTFLLAHGDTYTSTKSATDSQVTSEGGETTHTLTVNEMPSHTHGTTLYYSGGSGKPGTYGKRNADPTTFTSSATGGGRAHNNMPPYLVVYMWKRTA